MTPSSFTRAYVAHDLGGDLHRIAQRAAVVAAALYVTGLAAGVVIHWANDWLSGDRRPWPVTWPVTWGSVAKPDPLCPLSAMVRPGWVVNDSGTGSFVDLASWSVTELRSLAKARQLKRVYCQGLRDYSPIHLARKADLIAALQ